MKDTQKQQEIPCVQETREPEAQARPEPSANRPPGTRRLTPGQKLKMTIAGSLHRRVPQIIQMNAVECGAASLAMILNYYGHKISIAEIRARHNIGRDGLSARSIAQTARYYGLRVRALSVKNTDLRFASLPAIAHWEFNHFLVIEQWSPQFVDVVDPAIGRKRLTAAEFNDGFTGVLLLLEPDDNFSQRKAGSKLTARSYIKHYTRQASWTFLQIILASLVLQALGLVFPFLTEVIVDQIIPNGLTNLLPLLGAGMAIVIITRQIMQLLRSFLLIYLQTHINISITAHFFDHLLKLPQTFFQQRSSGDILSRISSNSVIRDLVSSQLISAFLDGSIVLVYLLILLSQSLFFGCFVCIVGILQVLLLIITNDPMRRLASRELEAEGKTQGYVAEMLAGMETLKASGMEQQAFQQWTNLFLYQLNISVKQSYISSIINSFSSLLSIISPIVFLLVGASQVLNGSIQLGTMLALNALAAAFLSPLSSLVISGQQMQIVQSHLARIADVMESQREQDLQQASPPPRLTGQIKVEHVSFQYDPQGQKILHDVSLTIRPGQKIALVGRTGSGKSTLGKLLLGLCLPTKGEIYYDDLPLHTLDYQAVRNQFGTVTQNSHIFSGSIRHNITFSNPDLEMERVITAAQLAELHEDILKMPMGYETYVSEGGSALSGGQRQRLAIARALAHQPSLLLLDEATSSLDVLTEQAVEHNLKGLTCTQVIIAHRLSTVRNADLILVMDDGCIVERGSHQELMRHNGYYANLIHNQLEHNESKR